VVDEDEVFEDVVCCEVWEEIGVDVEFIGLVGVIGGF